MADPVILAEGSGWKVRTITDHDSHRISEFWKADSWHDGYSLPEYFGNPIPSRTYTVAFEDDHGVVCYAVFSLSMRVSMQWNPHISRLRIARAILKCLNWVERIASMYGCSQLLFDTVNPKLARFFERLGFKKHETYIKEEAQWDGNTSETC